MASRFDDITRQVGAEQAYGPVYSAQYTDAIKSAKANELGRSLGLPPDVVESSMPDMLAADRVRKRMSQIQDNPPYARMMQNPRLAKSAIDDDHLATVAQAADQHKNYVDFSKMGWGHTLVAGTGVLLGRLLSGTAQLAQGIAGVGAAVGENAPSAIYNPDIMRVVPAWMQLPIAAAMAGGTYGRPAGALADRASNATHYDTSNRNFNDIASGVESAPASVAALAVTGYTGSPTAGAATLGAITGGQSYLTGRDAGLTPGEAGAYGIGDAIVETGTEIYAEKYLGRMFGMVPGGHGARREALHALGAEVGGEQVATALQGFNRWYWIDSRKGQTFQQFAATLPDQERSTLIATLTGFGLTVGAGHIVKRVMQPIIDRRTAVGIDRVMEAASKSTTRQTNPTDFREALNQLVEDSDASHIYVPVEQIQKAVGDKPIHEDPFWGKYTQQIQEAQQIGGDVAVPLADAATELAGTPQWEQIREHVRTAGGTSIAEATQKRSPEELTQMADQMSKVLTDAVRSTRFQQARGIVGDFAERGGQQGEAANLQNRLVSSWLMTQHENENAKRLAAGEDPISMQDFADQRMPQIVRMSQQQFEDNNGLAALEQATRVPATQQDAVVNIGMNVNDGSKISLDDIHQALASRGVQLTSHEIKQSNTEPTLVGRLSRALTPEEAHQVSSELHQDAIAQRVNGTGELHGPAAEQWGPFNPEFFIEPSESLQHDMELSSPPLDEHGNITLEHFSQLEGLTETDPDMWGSRGTHFFSRSERQYMRSAPSRTYFGIATGQNGGYKLEFSGRHAYTAKIPKERLYDVGKDPDKLWVRGDAAAGEQAIKDAGYAGYWHKNPQLGMVGVVFEPVSLTPRDETTFDQSVDLRTGDENLAPYGIAPGQRFKTRDIAAALEARQRDKFGRIARNDRSPEARDKIAQWMADEIEFEARDAENSGVGWYSVKFQQALDTLGKIFPELQSDPAKRGVMTALIAVTSDGQKVDNNLNMAAEVYRHYREMGTVLLPAANRGAIAGNLTKIDSMIKQYGEQGMVDRLLQEDTVSNLKKAAAEEGLQFSTGLQAHVKVPLSSIIFGPKLGLFFSNLMGKEGHLTMDRWWSRTFNRYRGELLDQATKQGLARVKTLLGDTGMSDEEALSQAAVHRDAYARKNYKGGTELEVAANTLYKAAFENLLDQPHNASDRTFMIETAQKAQQILAQRGTKMTLADIQAALWYYEKRLYGGLGARETASSGYDKAAEAYVARPSRPAVSSGSEAIPATGFAADFAAGAHQPLTLNQNVTPSEEVFYSAAQRAVANAPQEKASAQQWKALLTPGKTPGIKTEEVEWTGIHDWLDMQKGPIDKSALLQVLRDRGIRVHEVVQGETDPEVASRYEIKPAEGLAGFSIWRDGKEYDKGFPSQEAAQAAIDNVARDPTQFSNWSSDPNSRSYRELLITLPVGQGSNPDRAPSTHWNTEGVVAHARFMEKTDAEGKRVLHIEEVQSDWHQKGRDQGYETKVPKEEVARLRQDLDEKKTARDEARTALDALYDRVIERQKADGTNGLGLNPEERAEADALTEKFERAKLASQEAAMAWNTATGQSGKGIPEAPFKSSWPALVMKRMIRWAVDHGYDKVTWTTGKEQAERYNLSAATGPLRVKQLSNGKYGVKITAQAADQLVRNDMAIRGPMGHAEFGGETIEMTADQLKEAFGADIAKRVTEKGGEAAAARPANEARLREVVKERNAANDALLSAIKERDADRSDPEKFKQQHDHVMELQGKYDALLDEYHRLRKADEFVVEGDDLNVGGEGMKAFYDRNLVNITNDIIKKYGAKVGPIGVVDPRHIQTMENGIRQEELLRDRLGPEEAAAIEERIAGYRQQAEQGIPHPGFEITDKMREAASGGFPLFQEKRGNISIIPSDDGLMRSALIRTFESANFSTTIHELGHFFLADLQRRALSSGATDQERADWEAFKSWASDVSGEQIKDDGQIPTNSHEYFARGFERFVWEGSAPSIGLRRLFFRMREFMLDLYKSATRFNSAITPEIREVMGRMLASDAEITEQRQRMALVSGEIEKLMSDDERKAYTDLTEESRQDARDKLFVKVLSTLKNQKTMEARDRRNEIRNEVQAGVDQQPVFRALKMLRVGLPQADGSFSKVKLNRQQLVEAYGPDIEQQLPKTVPPIVSDQNTLDVDQIAALTGHVSGDELIKDLQNHATMQQTQRESGDRRSPRAKMVDDQTDQRFNDEVGDPFANLEEEARAALDNDRQADALTMELRAMSRKTGQRVTPWKLAKEFAQKRVRLQTSQEAISGRAIQQYVRNASRAAQQAEEALASGKVDEAFTAKQRQILNMALLSEAKIAKDQVEAAQKRLQNLASRETIPSIDQGYLDQAHQLLEDVDLRTKSQAEVDRRKAFEDWYLEQVQKGIEPVVPARYRTALGQTHWSRLSIDEFLELNTAVGQIVELGRLKQKLRDGQRERNYDEAVMEMVGQGETQKERSQSKTTDARRSLGGRVKSRLRGIDAAMIKVEQMVEWLDGAAKDGPWRRMIFDPMSAAQVREQDLRAKYVRQLNALIKGLPKEQVRSLDRMVDTPELIIRNPGHSQTGEQFRGTKDQILMMAMNWGNEGNRQRLLDGFGFTQHDMMTVFDRLMNKEDWDFVQGVWDMVDQLWPEIEQLERRVNGVAPEKVEATQVLTRHGPYKGGYFPVVFDPNESTQAELDEASKLSPNGAWHQVTTRAGSTRSRVAQVRNRPLLLDMSVITRHLGEVIHDITHREAVAQVRKILSDNRIRTVVNSRLGPEYHRRMGAWLENIATPGMSDAKSDPAATAVARHLNKGISLAGLGFRISTILVQPIGMANSISEIGSARMIEGIRTMAANPVKTYNEIVDRSGEMRHRFDTMDASIEDMMSEARAGKLKVIGPKRFVKYAFQGILYADMVVTTSTWIGAYNKALAEGEGEDGAVAYADGVIRKTQGAGGQKDRSAIMFASQFQRAFYPFFSYMNALYNQQRDVFHRGARVNSVGDALDVARRGWWVFMVPTLLQALIFGNGPDDDDPESWAKWLSMQVILGNFSSIPGVGALASAIGSGYGYRSNAWQGIGEDIKKNWEDIDKLATGEDEDLKGATIQRVLSTIGILTAKPLGQVSATARGIYDYEQGNAQPETAGDWYNLMTKGRIPDRPTAIQQIAAKVKG